MHPLLRKPLPTLTKEDIEALVQARVEESQQLEYKGALSLDAPGHRKEAAKDVSGMANGGGGYLIYGVSERALANGVRVPDRVTPIADGGLQARLEDVLKDYVRPALAFATRLIPSGSGFVLVVAVQPRSRGLHMVQAGGDRRFYTRQGLSTRPMDAHEIDEAYREEERSSDRLSSRLDDLPLVARLGGVSLGEQPEWPWPQPWVGLVVAPAEAAPTIFSLTGASGDDFDVSPPRLGSVPVHRESWRFDQYGYFEEDSRTWGTHPLDMKVSHRYDPPQPGVEYSGPSGPLVVLSRRVRLFRTGVCEWGRTYTREFTIPARSWIEDLHDALAFFARCYDSVAYFRSVRIWMVVEAATQAYLGVPADLDRTISVRSTPNADRLEYDEVTSVESLLADPMPVVQGAMDYMWQAYGWPRCAYFDARGTFRPQL